MLPFIWLAFQKGIRQGLMQSTGLMTAQDIFTEAVKQALKGKTFEHATLTIGTTNDELQQLLNAAIDQGQSVQQLGKAINDQFQLDSKVRSLRIARTELTDSINDGTTKTLAKEGYRQKQWSTVIDGREREAHAVADGQTVGIDDVFVVGGEACLYPGDDRLSPANRINCRCATVAAGLPDDRVRTLGESFLRVHGALENKFVLSLRREFERQRRRVLSHFPL